jgi:hypothetical protein
METGPGGQAAGDVSVIREGGVYYMYCTGGGVWTSADMLNWSFERVANVPVAPDVAKYRGKFYLCGNDSPLYVADRPEGPFAPLGEWTNTPGLEGGWNGAFDVHLFVDDDGQPYLYYSGRGVSGIFGVALDPDNLCRFAGKAKRLLTFDSSHVWERYGEMNEYPDVAWIEGPWMAKHGGRYYLHYSASGTQWKTYANGYYTSASPLGTFVYAPNNPLLRKTEGVVTGTAHGCIVEGPDGGLWMFYTIVLSNPPGGRRIGMDRIRLDAEGNMVVKVSDLPQWGPIKGLGSGEGDSGSLALSVNKLRAMNARSKVSSERSGHYGAYAVDNSSGTWWEPSPEDSLPTLVLELSPATRFDVTQLFEVDSYRLLLHGAPGFGWGRVFRPDIYQYTLEASMDGEAWAMVVDESGNVRSRNTLFGEIPPTPCRFVRLVMRGWPADARLGVLEFTVFGRSVGSLPALEAIPSLGLGWR